jgi:hypothetical protein
MDYFWLSQLTLSNVNSPYSNFFCTDVLISIISLSSAFEGWRFYLILEACHFVLCYFSKYFFANSCKVNEMASFVVILVTIYFFVERLAA